MMSKTLQETETTARDFVAEILSSKVGPNATVIALSGNLGSGKTTFTKFFARALGIAPETVTSPTFVIQKSFDIDEGDARGSLFRRLVHIDAYRLEKPEEIERLGWREILADPANIVLIEWPENIGNALPKTVRKISFQTVDENTREIVFN